MSGTIKHDEKRLNAIQTGHIPTNLTHASIYCFLQQVSVEEGDYGLDVLEPGTHCYLTVCSEFRCTFIIMFR